MAFSPWMYTERSVLDNVQQSPAVPGKLHPGESTRMLGWLLVPPHSMGWGGVCSLNERATVHATSLPSSQTTPWESFL